MLLLAVGSIVFLFFVLLIVKEFLPNRFKADFCALCSAVSLTWLVFLVLYFLGLFDDRIVLALLMGCSVVGLLYFVGHKVCESLKLFRLPFFLTLLTVAYFVIEQSFELFVFIFVLVLWLIFFVLFLYKNTKIIEMIIACCRDL